MGKFLIGVGCLIIGIVVGVWVCFMIKAKSLYFELSEDAVIEGVGNLKKGTLIKYDDSYPEGFTRFVLYLNADDIDLKKVEGTKRNEIIPYWLEAGQIDSFSNKSNHLNKKNEY